MENQGKRLLLAVAIAFGIMMVWTTVFPPEKPAPEAPKSEDSKSDSSDGSTDDSPDNANTNNTTKTQADSSEDETPRSDEQLETFTFDEIHVSFSNWGGAVNSWQLLGEQFHIPSDKSIPEDLVRLSGDAFYPFQVGFTDESTYQVPGKSEWAAEKISDTEIRYTWESKVLRITKLFRIVPHEYLLLLTVEFEVLEGDAKQALVISQYSKQDPKAVKDGGWTTLPREWKAACYVDGEFESWSSKSVAERNREERGEVKWLGFAHSFFLSATSPRSDRDVLGCKAYQASDEPGGMGIDLIYPTAALDPGKVMHVELASYMGPKYLDKLESIAAKVDFETKFEKSVDLGWFGFLAGPLLWILQGIHGLVGSWGIAIILLTMLVKLATLYWTHKSMKSMRAMSDLKPELDKMREKYKDDRQKQQVETMNLFKANGVNPLAGCLPMVLQMPIWFALYRALSVAAELYQAEFLWFADLTSPDPYFILPVFMTGTMLLQSRLTPTTATGFQQKLLTLGMPLMFGGFSIFFPAGLTLYISTNTVLTLLHHLYMKKTAKKKPIQVAKASESKSGSSSKGSVIDIESDDDGDDDDSDSAKEGPNNSNKGQQLSRGKRSRGNQRSRRGTKKKKGSRAK